MPSATWDSAWRPSPGGARRCKPVSVRKFFEPAEKQSMQIFSFHLAETTPVTALRAMYRPPAPGKVAGLRHAECLAAMTLGAPILSGSRLQLRNLAVFAFWESEGALDAFLAG